MSGFRIRVITCERQGRGLYPQEVLELGSHHPSPHLKKTVCAGIPGDPPGAGPGRARLGQQERKVASMLSRTRGAVPHVPTSSVRVKQSHGGKPLDWMFSKIITRPKRSVAVGAEGRWGGTICQHEDAWHVLKD